MQAIRASAGRVGKDEKCSLRGLLAAFSLLVMSSGCATITAYDPTSYKNATDLKAESLLLIEHATEPADSRTGDIRRVELALQQHLEYEKGKGNLNNPTVRQWELMAAPSGPLLGGLLRQWRAQGKGFSPAFVEGIQKNIGDAFDEIIRLEQHKVKK